jgi:hypothetical protein
MKKDLIASQCVSAFILSLLSIPVNFFPGTIAVAEFL